MPPIVERINKLPTGLQFNSSDVVLFPYLCGLETQITGRRSPWRIVFNEHETLQYEHAQNIRYWYGTGLGAQLERKVMVPFLAALVQRMVDGPDACDSYVNSTGAFHPNPPIATFTNDGSKSSARCGHW